MDKELKLLIDNLDDASHRELVMGMGIAQQVRAFLMQYGIPNELFVERMSMTPAEAEQFKNGTHEYDIKSMAKFETIMVEVKAEVERELTEQDAKLTEMASEGD